MGSKTLKYLEKIDISNVKKIIAYHGTSIFLIKLKSFCKKYDIELILDITEWYDYSDLSGGKFGLVSLDNSIRMNFVNPWIGNIIVISSFLHEFYKNKVNKIILIPFLIEVKNNNICNTVAIKNKIVKLVYIGSPGKKDKFDIILKVLSKINQFNNKIILDVYGLNLNEYRKINLKIDEQLIVNSYITFKGRIAHHLVADIYDKYHFSILFRPDKRYAQAGFPTKLVESLSCAIPIIASNVGDISKYIIHKKTGFLLDRLDESKLNIILNDILNLTDTDYYQMKKESIQIAIEKFNFKKEKKLIDFIKGEK
jgi:glycosyltransferase involved in cell wall biosynthesis